MEAPKSSLRSRMASKMPGKCSFPLYAQVLLAIVAGVLLGWLSPGIATNPWVQSLGTGFVKLIKMVVAPIIFFTVVSGISHVADAAKIGRVAIKAIFYFEIVSTFALGIGLVVANVVQPGRGLSGVKPDEAAVQKYQKAGAEHSPQDFVLNIIPSTLVGAFSEGEILQVLFVAILVGFALLAQGDRVPAVQHLIHEMTQLMFGLVAIVMKAAPIGAFGAMAFTVGKYGVSTLGNLLGLVATFYLTAALFVILVLGAIAAMAGFNIFRFLYYIRSELLLVVATSSSESALPSLLSKMELMGCSQSVVGLVVPLGYSFNLDGTNVYMTLATLFISQAMGVQLTFGEQMKILGVAMLTSKGATGVTGAGFITLASTLSAVRPELVPAMAILLGVDKFMSECRAITNMIGNGVACVVVAANEGELDRDIMRQALGLTTVMGDDTCQDKQAQLEDRDADDELSTDVESGIQSDGASVAASSDTRAAM